VQCCVDMVAVSKGVDQSRESGPLRGKERCFALRMGYFLLAGRRERSTELNVLSFCSVLFLFRCSW